METVTKRLPRHRREPEKVKFDIQPRDDEGLKWLRTCRLVTSDHLRLLLPGSDQVITRRLRKWYHKGYADRVKVRNQPEIYGLGNLGADRLADLGEMEPRGKIDWTDKNRDLAERYREHTLMVTDFRVCLELALRERPGVRLLAWIPDGEIKENVTIIEERKGRGGKTYEANVVFPVEPDAFFVLEDNGDEMFFFLEADRSSEAASTRFKTKLLGYWHYWKQKKYEDLIWSCWDNDLGYVERKGIKSFRVVTSTKSEWRANNLKRVARTVDDRRTGSDMFWFTDSSKYSLEDPMSIFGKIWETPKEGDTDKHLLLE